MATLHGTLTAASATLTGTLSATGSYLTGVLVPGWVLQSKTVTPSAEEQTIMADTGYGGLSSVTVAAVPNNYGLITWNGSTLTVS